MKRVLRIDTEITENKVPPKMLRWMTALLTLGLYRPADNSAQPEHRLQGSVLPEALAPVTSDCFVIRVRQVVMADNSSHIGRPY